MAISKAVGWNARSYKVEIIDSKDPLVQLEASKWSIKSFFKELLDEIKGSKYQKTVKVLLRKRQTRWRHGLAPVYFSSTTKTEMNFKYDFDKSFKEVLYRIHNWINEGSGWITESIDAEYVKIFCL